MRASLQLGTIFVQLDKRHKFYPFLNTAMNLYLIYTREIGFPQPIVIYLASTNCKDKGLNTRILLITSYLRLLQHMHESCILRPWDKHDFMITVHNFLNNKSRIAIEHPLGEGLLWSLAAIEIGKYLIIRSRFIEAKNYLCAAQYILCLYSKNSAFILFNINYDIKYKISFHEFILYADCAIFTAWGSYGNLLLLISYLKQLSVKTEIKTKKSVSCNKELLIFTKFPVNLKDIAYDVTDTYVSNINEAKQIFVMALQNYTIAETCLQNAIKTNIV